MGFEGESSERERESEGEPQKKARGRERVEGVVRLGIRCCFLFILFAFSCRFRSGRGLQVVCPVGE